MTPDDALRRIRQWTEPANEEHEILRGRDQGMSHAVAVYGATIEDEHGVPNLVFHLMFGEEGYEEVDLGVVMDALEWHAEHQGKIAVTLICPEDGPLFRTFDSVAQAREMTEAITYKKEGADT